MALVNKRFRYLTTVAGLVLAGTVGLRWYQIITEIPRLFNQSQDPMSRLISKVDFHPVLVIVSSVIALGYIIALCVREWRRHCSD